MNSIEINRIPSPTWNKLGINHTTLSPDPSSLCHARPVETEGDYYPVVPADFSVPGSAGAAFTRLIEEILPRAERFSSLPEKPLLIRDTLFPGQVRRLSLRAARGSHLILITRCLASSSPDEQILEDVQILAEAASHVTIVQILDGNSQEKTAVSLAADAQEDAKIDVTQIVLGGAGNILGGNIFLRGNRSSLDAAIHYQYLADHELDLNWVITHAGQKSESRILAQGSLNDRCKKVFRGTIEFLRGAAGSVGEETEDVLLLSDEVHNQTVPVILCSEENVQGNHGASIGRLSDELLYYLQSRGPSKEDIIRLLTAARLKSALRRIPDSETVQWLQQRLDENPD